MIPQRTYHGVILMIAVAALAVGCSSGPKATTAPAAETPVTTATPTPREVPEQVVSEPSTEAIPSEEVREELPEDIQELNRRGYLEDVFFDTNRHELRPDGREALAKNAAWLLRFPSVVILVEGHCAERNTREYNLALCERRATAGDEYRGRCPSGWPGASGGPARSATTSSRSGSRASGCGPSATARNARSPPATTSRPGT
mgnify:CR=1 FL=1